MQYPTPHGDKLRALLENDKLPVGDRTAVSDAITRYEAWNAEISCVDGNGMSLIDPLVASLNRYKMFIDIDLVFDSKDNFLYRQKGQLKIDNTVLEEFLPWLVGRVFSDTFVEHDLSLGPTNAISQLRFESSLLSLTAGGGMAVRSKDHDFAIARPLFIKASHRRDFSDSSQARTHLAYVVAEIKTNLDKTMFQEASATADDLRMALPNSRYFLLCEWLDMTPISTAVTAIEEVIVLRKARRLSADIRSQFSTVSGRKKNRDLFKRYLAKHALSPDVFRRFLCHLKPLLGDSVENEGDVLDRGWF